MMDRGTRPTDSRFDVELANRLAHLESYNKHLYRPNTYLHKWWARRCGSTFRLILKSLVEDADERAYYAAGGLEGKIVLDPMLGGGTTLHEAIRLGANVIGFDVDPIPVLQARATLSDISLERIEEAFAYLMVGLEKKLAPLYLTSCARCNSERPVRYIMYGLRQLCDCGEVTVVDSLLLRRERDGGAIRLCEQCHQVVRNSETCSCPSGAGRTRIFEKSVKRCPTCGIKFRELTDEPFYRRYRPLLAVANCEVHGRLLQAVTNADHELLEEANAMRHQLTFLADTEVAPGPKSSDLIRRGIHDYQDLFSSRQLLYLSSAIELLRDFEPKVQLYLSLLVSTSLEFNVMLCGYKGAGVRRAGAIRHAFSHHAYSFPYTAVENNPVYPGPSSGALRQLFEDRVRRARQWSKIPKERSLAKNGPKFVEIHGESDIGAEVKDPRALTVGQRRFVVRQGTAADTVLADNSVDFVVTDPPYYDSVQYGDLSMFFRVWLRQMISSAAVAEIQWDYQMVDAAVMYRGDKSAEAAHDHYLGTMSAIFGECRRVLKPEPGRLIFSYHHWKAAGWSAISIALKRAGFRLIDRYVVHSENPVSVHIANLNALTDDAILVLAVESGAPERQWPQLESIRTSDSSQFCRDCAESLGWILAADITESEIADWWRKQLR
jgi:putative DNA methylase